MASAYATQRVSLAADRYTTLYSRCHLPLRFLDPAELAEAAEIVDEIAADDDIDASCARHSISPDEWAAAAYALQPSHPETADIVLWSVHLHRLHNGEAT